MKDIKIIIVSALIGAIVAFVGLQLVGDQPAQDLGKAGTGATHYQTENFLQGLFAGTSGQFSISNTGVVVYSGSISPKASSSQLIIRSLDSGDCVYLTFASTSGGISTTTVTCP